MRWTVPQGMKSASLVVAVALGVSACLFEAKAEQLKGPDVPVPPTYFGQHIHRADRGTEWPGVRFGSWRLWDADVTWPYLEPQKGQWDFARLDKYLAMAEQHGVDVVMPLAFSPPWASARPSEKSSYGPGQAAEPRNIEDWKNYVRTVATRYKGRIKLYEVWNEVNEPGFYTGSTLALVELVREAHVILKEIDPEIRVVSPSFVGGEKHVPEQLEHFLKAGGGKFVDVFGYHFYVPSTQPEAMLPLVKIVREKLNQHGLADKPLWNTETGWWIENDDGYVAPFRKDPHWRSLGQEHAAAYVMRAMLLGWASGLGRYYWYSWDNEGMGMMEPKARKPKAAARGYDALNQWVVGRKVTACSAKPSIWACEVQGEGGTRYIVWSADDKPREWPLPDTVQSAQVTNLHGKAKETAGRTVSVGAIPQLVSAAAKN